MALIISLGFLRSLVKAAMTKNNEYDWDQLQLIPNGIDRNTIYYDVIYDNRGVLFTVKITPRIKNEAAMFYLEKVNIKAETLLNIAANLAEICKEHANVTL